MKMYLRFDYQAMFFIKQLSTDNEKTYFFLSLLLVIIYGSLLSYMIEKHFHRKKLAFIIVIYTFFSMFIIMTYNLWVIISLILGKILGFTIYAHKAKKSFSIDYFKI